MPSTREQKSVWVSLTGGTGAGIYRGKHNALDIQDIQRL